MEASRSVGLEYVDFLFDLADSLERLSHAHEVQCPSCGARWPASRMQTASTVHGDGKRTVTYCLHSCSTMRWTRPMLDLVLEEWAFSGDNDALEEVD